MDEIELDGWKLHLLFSAVHLIPKYEKCGRLHGHTYAVHVKIVGEKNRDGIIMDFTEIKDGARKIIEELDHRILIPEKNPSIKVEKNKVKMLANGKEYIFPTEDCILLPIHSTTAENIAEYILDKFVENVSFPKNVKSVEIKVDEGPGQGAKISKKL
jgi:6-pyruvoyltetrahydropterin/6-carboxytetrahydropterin synthase